MDARTKLKGILYVMYQVEKDLVSLQNVYNDHRSCIEESARMAGDILSNIEGHIKDINEGKE
jgi:hypothetical protein